VLSDKAAEFGGLISPGRLAFERIIPVALSRSKRARLALSGQAAHEGRGAKDRGEYRQATKLLERKKVTAVCCA